MTREFPDELFSAYLDGELDAAQSAMVERHLAASEPDRQLVAELKSVRDGMKKLPRHSASSGFTDRVVAAAIATQPENPGFGVVPGTLVRRRVITIAAS